MKRKHAPKRAEMPVSWLPFDSRLVLPIFSFGHVKGAAKVFMIVEMLLATAVVLGTLFRLILYYLY